MTNAMPSQTTMQPTPESKPAATRPRRRARTVPLLPVLTAAAILLALFELVLFAYVPFSWAIAINGVLIVIALLMFWLRKRRGSRARRAAARAGRATPEAAGSVGFPGGTSSTGGAGARQGGAVRGLLRKMTGRGRQPTGAVSGGALGGLRSNAGRLLRGSSGGSLKTGGAGRTGGGPGRSGSSPSPKGGRIRGLLGKLRKGPRTAKGSGAPTGPSSGAGGGTGPAASGSKRGPRSLTPRGLLGRIRSRGRSLKPAAQAPARPASGSGTGRPAPTSPKVNQASRPTTPKGGGPVNRPDRPTETDRKPAPNAAGGPRPNSNGNPPMAGGADGLRARLSEMNLYQFHKAATATVGTGAAELMNIIEAVADAAECQPVHPSLTEELRSIAAAQRALMERACSLHGLAQRGNESDYARAEQPRGGSSATEAKADSREYRNQ